MYSLRVVLVVLILSLDAYLEESQSLILPVARVFGFIWAGFVLASGMITNIGLDQVALLFPNPPQAADTLWQTILILQDGLGGGVEMVGGIWILGTSWVGMQGQKLPWLLNLMGIVTGLSGILTGVPGLGMLQIVFGMGQLLWFAYLGVYLLLFSSK